MTSGAARIRDFTYGQFPNLKVASAVASLAVNYKEACDGEGKNDKYGVERQK
jgi:hypothetical protein